MATHIYLLQAGGPLCKVWSGEWRVPQLWAHVQSCAIQVPRVKTEQAAAAFLVRESHNLADGYYSLDLPYSDLATTCSLTTAQLSARNRNPIWPLRLVFPCLPRLVLCVELSPPLSSGQNQNPGVSPLFSCFGCLYRGGACFCT